VNASVVESKSNDPEAGSTPLAGKKSME